MLIITETHQHTTSQAPNWISHTLRGIWCAKSHLRHVHRPPLHQLMRSPNLLWQKWVLYLVRFMHKIGGLDLTFSRFWGILAQLTNMCRTGRVPCLGQISCNMKMAAMRRGMATLCYPIGLWMQMASALFMKFALLWLITGQPYQFSVG